MFSGTGVGTALHALPFTDRAGAHSVVQGAQIKACVIGLCLRPIRSPDFPRHGTHRNGRAPEMRLAGDQWFHHDIVPRDYEKRKAVARVPAEVDYFMGR